MGAWTLESGYGTIASLLVLLGVIIAAFTILLKLFGIDPGQMLSALFERAISAMAKQIPP